MPTSAINPHVIIAVVIVVIVAAAVAVVIDATTFAVVGVIVAIVAGMATTTTDARVWASSARVVRIPSGTLGASSVARETTTTKEITTIAWRTTSTRHPIDWRGTWHLAAWREINVLGGETMAMGWGVNEGHESGGNNHNGRHRSRRIPR